MFYRGKPFEITLDSGATTSYIKHDVALSLSLNIAPNNQLALLADHKTRIASLGEVDFNVTLGTVVMRVRALVMKNLQAQCFGGTTFHVDNDIHTKIKSGTVTIHGRFIVDQSNPYPVTHVFPPPVQQVPDSKSTNSNGLAMLDVLPCQSTQASLHAISLPENAVTFPSDFLKIPLPLDAVNLNVISISPSFPMVFNDNRWRPQICQVADGYAFV